MDQIFDIFSLRRDIGFQTWSNPKIKIKCRPGKTCSPSCSKLARFCSNLARLLSRPLYTKLLTKILISFWKAEISAQGVQEIAVYANFWIIFHLSPHQPPISGGMDPKSFKGGYMKLHPRRIDQFWDPPPQDAAPLSRISSFGTFWPHNPPYSKPFFSMKTSRQKFGLAKSQDPHGPI